MTETKTLKLTYPANEEVFSEIPLMDFDDISRKTDLGKRAFASWRNTSVIQRISAIQQIIQWFQQNKYSIAKDITHQIGKPILQSENEVNGAIYRMEGLCRIAEKALEPRIANSSKDLQQKVLCEPLGLILDITAWNYPLLIAANIVIAGVLSGNAVILKHSSKTPLSGKAFEDAFKSANVPENLVQNIICDHQTLADSITAGLFDHISFTGSVTGGKAISNSVSGQFIDLGLELGGKDPAYITEFAELNKAVPNVIDGVFYNAGQSCCGVERIYVHSDKYDLFCQLAVAEMDKLVIGHPEAPETTMGPLASKSAISFLEKQKMDAIEKGAEVREWKGELPNSGFYFRPFIAFNVHHKMSLMTEESFGPVVGIMPVDSDEEAIKLMNDSAYGLTASIWTSDPKQAYAIGTHIQTGTVFMNCCDILDPELPWVGVKNSGRGASLGIEGIRQLTRPKVYHFIC